jgi:transposase InsO family protein
VGAAGVVSAVRHEHPVHQAGLAVGEPLHREFNGRVRDELLNVEEFTSLTVAQVVIEAWRMEYNTYRPHSTLDGLTPAEYAATWTRTTQPAQSGGPATGVPSIAWSHT